MPQSRKRKAHTYRRPGDAPKKQKTKGGTVGALLFGVFGLLIALFASGLNYVFMAIATIAGAAIGYIVGKKMEKDA